MRKFLFFILSLFSASAVMAQTTDADALFDFAHPMTLNPSISFEDVAGTHVIVSDKVFTDGPVKIYFGKDFPVPITEGYTPGEYYLTINRGATFYIACSNDVELLSIDFKAGNIASEMGSINIQPGYRGTYTLNTGWNAVDVNGNELRGVHEVGFNNGGKDAFLRTIKVTYRTPMDVVSAVSFSPSKGSEVETFDALDVTFNYDIASTAGPFDILDSKRNAVATIDAASFNGRVASLVPNEPVTTPGNYTINFPTGAFLTSTGLYTKSFNYNFTVVEPSNTFNPINVPNEEVENEMPNTISILFDGNIGNKTELTDMSFDVIGNKTGPVTTAKASVFGPSTFVLTLDDAVNFSDVFTITIPEKTIYNYNRTKYNSEFVITYKVAGANAPSAEVLAQAQNLLKATGVGYPTADAQARKVLENLVENQDRGDEDFINAMNDFLATTEITLPEADKYYHIVSVTPEGKKAYLAYNGTSVTVSDKAADAYSFYTETENASTLLSTIDGKYLHSLVESDKYRYTSAKNLTDDKADVSYLTFEKLVSSENMEAAFGKMAFKGLIGKKFGLGDEVVAYSTILTSANEIVEGETQTYFSENISSAFVLEEASAPSVIPVSYTLSFNPTNAAKIDTLRSVTLTIPNVQELAYNPQIPVYVLNSATSKTVNMTVQQDGANTFVLTVPTLDDATYKLVIPEGAFTYVARSKTFDVQEITDNFTISNPDDFKIDFRSVYEMRVISKVGTENFVSPEDLNDFDIVAETLDTHESVKMAAADVTIQLLDAGLRVVTSGKLHPMTTSEQKEYVVLVRNGVDLGIIAVDAGSSVYYTNGEHDVVLDGDIRDHRVETINTYHLVLKLDKELTSDELPRTTTSDGRLYHYIFQEATFGDENFGKYLENHSSVMKRDCHVNAYMNFPVYVLNPDPTGIEDIKAEDGAKAVIFDLSGRRVENMSTPGIYIINGKKFIKK